MTTIGQSRMLHGAQPSGSSELSQLIFSLMVLYLSNTFLFH